MKNIPIFLIPIFLFVIQSCEESPEKGIPINRSFVYPLNIGNQWNYKMSVVYSDIRPDSIKHRLIDYSIEYQDIVTKDTLLNSIHVYEIKEEGEDLSDSYAYYANETEGLFQYAYGYSNDSTALAKANALKRFRYKGICFNNSFDLINQLKKPVGLSKSQNDSIYILEEPNLIYLYPWEIGVPWTYCFDPIRIVKKVIGKETIETDAGVYDCYKIQWTYYSYADLIYHEYIGSAGLIKTVIKVDNMDITTIEYPEGIGQADMKIVMVLTDVNF